MCSPPPWSNLWWFCRLLCECVVERNQRQPSKEVFVCVRLRPCLVVPLAREYVVFMRVMELRTKRRTLTVGPHRFINRTLVEPQRDDVRLDP